MNNLPIVLSLMNTLILITVPLLGIFIKRRLEDRDALQRETRDNQKELSDRFSNIEEAIFRHEIWITLIANELGLNLPVSKYWPDRMGNKPEN